MFLKGILPMSSALATGAYYMLRERNLAVNKREHDRQMWIQEQLNTYGELNKLNYVKNEE